MAHGCPAGSRESLRAAHCGASLFGRPGEAHGSARAGACCISLFRSSFTWFCSWRDCCAGAPCTNGGAERIARAPRTLIETTRIFQQSDIARDWLGDAFVDHFAATRDWEWRQWLDGVTDWELKRYFEII